MNKSNISLWILFIVLFILICVNIININQIKANQVPIVHVEHAIITPDVGDLVIEEMKGDAK